MSTKGKLLADYEWRQLGIQQTKGWVHYETHRPEPHILMFRRAKGTDPVTGLPPANFIAPSDTYW
jgi:cyclin-dependent kinase regulatory subunit CKS1